VAYLLDGAVMMYDFDASGDSDWTRLDCDDFATQVRVQTFSDAQGWTAENDPEGLDDATQVDDGVSCGYLPCKAATRHEG
jgi:hypothetical protein